MSSGGKVSLKKDLKDLKEMGFSRESVLGVKTNEQLLAIEGKRKELEKSQKKREMICLFCGKKSFDFHYRKNHKCGKSVVVLVSEVFKVKPSVAILKNSAYYIKYCKRQYKFKTKYSAILFRQLVGRQRMPIKDALKMSR